VELADEATAIGFAGVMSGPLVRSSYRAGRLYRQAAPHPGSPTVRCIGG
jgi:lipoic acid synthetase